MTTIRLQLENSTFDALKRYAENKRMSIQEVLHSLVDQLTFGEYSDTEVDEPSWKRPLPKAISDIMPKRKEVSFDRYEDYSAEIEKQLRAEA